MLPARPRVPFSRRSRARFVVRRRCPVVAPPANFSRASGTGAEIAIAILPRSETIPHGFDTSLVALPSRVQHEKPGILALADASATRSLIHRRHPH